MVHRVQGEKLRVAVSEGIVGAAATLKEPVLVPDVTADPRLLDGQSGKTKSELAHPHAAPGQSHWRAGPRKPAIELLHGRPCADAFHPGVEFGRISGETRGSTNNSPREEGGGSSAISRRQKRIQGRASCGRCPPKITVSIWLRGICSAREVCGRSLRVFCATVRQQLGIALGRCERQKGPRLLSTVQWPSES